MNGLSVTELCCLFCYPPCPGRIAAKLAFLPPEPTYSLVPEPEPRPGGVGTTPLGTLRTSTGTPGRWKLHLMERSDFQYSQRELDTVEVFLTKSSRGNRIACMYVRCVPGARLASKTQLGQTQSLEEWRGQDLGGILCSSSGSLECQSGVRAQWVPGDSSCQGWPTRASKDGLHFADGLCPATLGPCARHPTMCSSEGASAPHLADEDLRLGEVASSGCVTAPA